MASNVNGAFSEFLSNKVRLDTERTKVAKASKNWLIDEVKKFPGDGLFPPFHPDISIEYGSFSRKTKIRPLDDIDIMFIFHAQGCTYMSGTDPIQVYNTNNSGFFADLCFEGTSQLNSIKVVNRFKDYLRAIPQYKNADIKRNQEAVTLELQSYEWVYDIVPCFITTSEWDGRTYYLIPDGSGNWKRTDPRIDKRNIVEIQAGQEVSIIDVIRLIKYWNCRPTMPSIPSYMLENIVLNFFKAAVRGKWVDIEFKNCLAYITNAVLNPVQDPKNIQGDLNSLAWEDRTKIRDRSLEDYSRASAARTYEEGDKMKEAINKWREVFGDEFPEFTSQLAQHA
jgi:hypothetical protein